MTRRGWEAIVGKAARVALAGVTLAVGTLAIGPTPAAADSMFFGYSSGPGDWRHRHDYYHRPYGYYREPRVVYYSPPIYYPPPPPRVVYVAPPPVVYGPAGSLSAVPTSPPYQAANGQYCREYQATVGVGGVPQQTYGTACQQPDGTWRVMN